MYDQQSGQLNIPVSGMVPEWWFGIHLPKIVGPNDIQEENTMVQSIDNPHMSDVKKKPLSKH